MKNDRNIDTLSNHSFQWALSNILAGNRVKRASQDGFIFLVPGSEFKVNRKPLLGIFEEGHPIKYLPHIDMCINDTVQVWEVTQEDLFAQDWGLYLTNEYYS